MYVYYMRMYVGLRNITYITIIRTVLYIPTHIAFMYVRITNRHAHIGPYINTKDIRHEYIHTYTAVSHW